VGEPIFGMDASRISMARLLAYLFEVTERFGMETRTELILLQRTMVVVEGVARSLDPEMNIWTVARPVVEEYIRENVGPKALVRDLALTARVLARFGPRLPQLAEAALLAQANPPRRRDGFRSGPRHPSSRPRAYRFRAAASAPQVGSGPFERRIRKRDGRRCTTEPAASVTTSSSRSARGDGVVCTVTGAPVKATGISAEACMPIQPLNCPSPAWRSRWSDSSSSLVRTCCSTPEKVASWVAYSVDSIGLSGSWFFSCVVSKLQEGLEIRRDGGLSAAGRRRGRTATGASCRWEGSPSSGLSVKV
jgi:hypothetical protein